MQANLYATFRLLAGVKVIPLDLQDGKTIQEAILAIIEKHPVLRSHWLNQVGELHAHVHVFLNGVDTSTLPDGLQTRLKCEDNLDFFPPVAGGSFQPDLA